MARLLATAQRIPAFAVCLVVAWRVLERAPIYVNAQSLGLESTCLDPSPDFSWMYNSQGDSPCQVANNLPYACGQFQIGPTLNNSPCICNSVTYSLAYACRLCSGVQGDQIAPFSDYASSYDCESTSVGSFPKPLPSGTVIPAWAYLPLTSDGKLDIAKAENGANEGSGEVSTPSVASQSSSQGVSKPSQTSASPPTSNTNGVTPTATGAHSQTDGHTGTQASTSTPSGSTASTTSDTLQATGSDSRVSDANALSTVVSTKTQASTATITTTGPTGAVALPTPEDPTSERRISKAAVAGAIVAAIVLVTSSTIIGICVYRRWSRRQSRQVAEGIEGERRKSQEGLRGGAQASPEAISPHDLKFYDPDDPDTYPPPMSEILPKAVHPLLSPNRLPAQV